MTDETLILTVARAQHGDTRAFDKLVRQYQNTAVAYARTLLRSPAAAEDAAQEAFVQAWRDLPRLTQAAAFGGWLRRIVFKYCDRARRSAHPMFPLDDTIALPKDLEPSWIAEREDEAASVHAAIAALPTDLREATLLYYLAGLHTKEIAAFLELPTSTVKNRLFAARKRLRRELWTMAETILEEEKPSNDEDFADKVLSRVLREFQDQERSDCHTADRELLEQGRTALFQLLATGAALTEQAVRDGFIVLWRKRDWNGLAALLIRYLSQPTSDSEMAWAYLHLANAFAISGSAAGAVLTHETFEHWFPGKCASLGETWPFYPVEPDTAASQYAGDEVRMLFLMQSGEFATSYLGVWRNNDYLAKVDSVLSQIPATESNRRKRFYPLRMACVACESAGEFDRAKTYVTQMHTLASGAKDDVVKAKIQAQALGHEIHLARQRHDQPAFDSGVERFLALLDASARSPDAGHDWLRSERHNLACELVRGDRHGKALPLLEANAQTGGQLGGWGYLMHAATVWHLSHDRERTIALLREARAHDDRDIASLIKERPEFADIRDDGAFLEAIGAK